eukprot:CAMPEP_0198297086 /NCGR_PEP_ID=MMETSP1449-20131203/35360_1 /TAXON_ID=420275 /ORGANISM="Attheya septentrionalis, Strain CCMP2084" /LENGTH=482 /DNA_ID=CAMNT_0043997911 /DNA_START=132 /DNA_END=1577 /DNA_ORIENTATION=+
MMEFQCCGTRTVDLTAGNKAMVAVFCPPTNDESATNALDVVMTQGSATYHGRIVLQDVKLSGSRSTSETGGRARLLVSHLLTDEHKDKNVSVEYRQASYFHAIQMTIRERLSSGIVRLVWSGALKETKHELRLGHVPEDENDDSDSAGPSSSALPVAILLGNVLREFSNELDMTKRQSEQVASELAAWKDTATQLDAKWQTEKDELTQRFLVLLNRVKGDLRRTKNDLQRAQDIAKATPTNALIQPGTVVTEDQLLETAADDDDYLLYDPEMVERLANGPSKSAKTKPPTKEKVTSSTRSTQATAEKKSRDLSLSQSSQNNNITTLSQASSASHPTRRNPLTGAIEVWDAQEILNVVGCSQEEEVPPESSANKGEAHHSSDSGSANISNKIVPLGGSYDATTDATMSEHSSNTLHKSKRPTSSNNSSLGPSVKKIRLIPTTVQQEKDTAKLSSLPGTQSTGNTIVLDDDSTNQEDDDECGSE